MKASRMTRHGVLSGFNAGFTSPFLVFTRRPAKFSYRHTDTVAEAWRLVGEEIAQASEAEGRRVEQATKEKRADLCAN